MAYTKTVWQDGDVITAQKMNKIENGIESSTFVVRATEQDGNVVFDKTYKEIREAMEEGILPIVLWITGDGSEYDYSVSTGFIRYYMYYPQSEQYEISFEDMSLVGESENDYPFFPINGENEQTPGNGGDVTIN